MTHQVAMEPGLDPMVGSDYYYYMEGGNMYSDGGEEPGDYYDEGAEEEEEWADEVPENADEEHHVHRRADAPADASMGGNLKVTMLMNGGGAAAGGGLIAAHLSTQASADIAQPEVRTSLHRSPEWSHSNPTTQQQMHSSGRGLSGLLQ